MCGRFVSVTDADELAAFFAVDDRELDDLPPSWNVAPTDRVAAVVEHRDRRVLVGFRWGLVPHWAEDAKSAARHINARAESVASTPAFRDAFARHRCLIPADGFYEWRRDADGTRVPHLIARRDGAPLALAGVWASWRPNGGADPEERLRSCAIITTAANDLVAPLHDRMPVVLDAGAWDEWLDREHDDPQALRHLLQPAPVDALVVRRVSQEVNSVRNNHPGLLDPA